MERRLGRLSPRRPPVRPALRVFVALVLALSLVSCRSSAPAGVADDREGEGRDWYCEPAGAGGWQCIPNVLQPPAPPVPAPVSPVPVETAPPIPPREQAPAVPAQPQAPAIAPQVQAPIPPQQPAPPVAPAPAQMPDDLPLYVRLAHRLDGTPLLELPSSFYAVQLYAALSRAKVEQLAVDSGLEGMAGARVERDGKVFYVLLAGVYSDRERAMRAERSLPANIRAWKPWVRSLGGLQESMRRADALVAGP